jgi:hypothetical protein
MSLRRSRQDSVWVAGVVVPALVALFLSITAPGVVSRPVNAQTMAPHITRGDYVICANYNWRPACAFHGVSSWMYWAEPSSRVHIRGALTGFSNNIPQDWFYFAFMESGMERRCQSGSGQPCIRSAYSSWKVSGSNYSAPTTLMC